MSRTRPRRQYEIRWPNVVRIDHVYRPTLSLDWSRVPPLVLDASTTAQVAELAPILEGKPDVTQIDRIELERLAREFRTQRIIFEDGARRLRPDAARLAGQQGGAAGAAGAPGGAVHPLRQDCRFTRRCSTRTTCAAA